jgi:hypothetical protein
MRILILLLVLCLPAPLCAQRYFGSFSIGSYWATAVPFDGGVGGFSTHANLILADAAVLVSEAQDITWEWINLRPQFAVDTHLGPVLLQFRAPEKQFDSIFLDLNPTHVRHIWSAPATFLPYDDLLITGTYSSFSYQSEFSEIFRGVFGNAGFHITTKLDYSEYPNRLRAILHADDFGSLLPDNRVVLEPKLRLRSVQLDGTIETRPWLNLTPPGDANSDGRVSFEDFLILSENFGKQTTWSGGDFSGDRLVGFEDFLLLAENFDGQPAQAVPEPDSILWLPVCLLMLFRAKH